MQKEERVVLIAPPFCPGLFWGKLLLSGPLRRKQLVASKKKKKEKKQWVSQPSQLLRRWLRRALSKMSEKGALKSQMLRPERRDVVVRRGRQEDVHVDHDVEEGLVQNVGVEVVVDEVLEVDLLLPTMSKTKTMQMSMLTKKVDVAKDDRLEDVDRVVKSDVDVVGKEMLMMCRCGWGGLSLLVCRGEPGVAMALLPC